jgi:hypothetical protein
MAPPPNETQLTVYQAFYDKQRAPK